MIDHDSTKHPGGIISRTTRETSITDWLGNDVMAGFVKTETGSERVDWTYHIYNTMGLGAVPETQPVLDNQGQGGALLGGEWFREEVAILVVGAEAVAGRDQLEAGDAIGTGERDVTETIAGL